MYHKSYLEQRIILEYKSSNKRNTQEIYKNHDYEDSKIFKALMFRTLKLFMIVHPYSYFNFLRARVENLESFPPTQVNMNDRIYREKLKRQLFTLNPMLFSGVKTQSQRIFERYSELAEKEWKDMFNNKKI